MAKKSVVTEPVVTVEVAGELYELKPTLAAVRAVNAGLGGLVPAFRQVQDINVDAFALVIAAGAGLRLKTKEYDDFVDRIWRSPDKAAIGAPLSDFLSLLLRGGRPAEDEKDDVAGEAVETPAGNA